MRVVLQVSNGKTNLKRVVIQSDTVIGRSTDCQLRVASSLVSRKHCQIVVSDARVTVTDLGSANGTFLNGKPLPPNVATELSSGSEVSIGPVQFLVQFQPPTAVEMPTFGDHYDSADSFSVDPEVQVAAPEVASEAPPSVEPTSPVESAPPAESAPVAVVDAPVIAEPPAPPIEAPPVESQTIAAPEPLAPTGPVADVPAQAAPAEVVAPTPPADPVFGPAAPEPKPAVLVARVVARPVAPPPEPVVPPPESVAPPASVAAPPAEAAAPPVEAPPAEPVPVLPAAVDDSEQTITAFPDFAGLSSENADEAAAFDFLNSDASSSAPAIEISAAADDILEEPSVDLVDTAPADPPPAEASAKPKRGFWNMLGMGKKATPTKAESPQPSAPAPAVEAPAEPVVGPPQDDGAPGGWDFAETEPAPAEIPPAAEEGGADDDDALNDFFKNLP